MHQLSQQAFAARPAPYDDELDRTAVPLERRLVATDGGTIVGKLVIWELGQWFGGRRVPMGGISGVAVAPAYRGRRVASSLLDDALTAMRERGEVLSTLYPMNHTLYRRHGWEVAGAYPEHDIDLRALTDLPKPTRQVTVRESVEADLPALRALNDEVSREVPGNVSYGPEFAARRLLGHPGAQEGYVAEVDGVLTGALTLGHGDGHDERELYTLSVRNLFAADLDSELALLRVVAAHYPVARTARLVTSVSSALPLLLGERDLRPAGAGWCWMARLVDAPGAIRARGFAPEVDVEIHLDLIDPTAPWNAGPHVLRVKDGEGQLEPGGRGDVLIDIGRLTSLYTGWADPRRLAHAGLIGGAEESDLAALDRTFGGRTPWARDFF